jgi:putative transposase
MSRANRYDLPGLVWHITHRCHNRDFLLKFRKDRDRYRHWLYEAKKRYGLILLNYTLTCNHIHLLAYDSGEHGVIERSMQLAEGRIAQEYNKRQGRFGAFWQDRYHATAVNQASTSGTVSLAKCRDRREARNHLPEGTCLDPIGCGWRC